MAFRSASLALAGVAAALFLALGTVFMRAPFVALDQAGMPFFGSGIALAVVFTRSGYSAPIIGLGVVGMLIAILLRTNLALPLLLFVAQVAGQASANAAKAFFHRPRPDAWLFRLELGYSYPSGHAVTAIVFYLGWALIVWSWPIPKTWRVAVVCAMVLWALGIGWARLALGAHYLTDVLGGYLLGTAWLFIWLAVASLATQMLASR